MLLFHVVTFFLKFHWYQMYVTSEDCKHLLSIQRWKDRWIGFISCLKFNVMCKLSVSLGDNKM